MDVKQLAQDTFDKVVTGLVAKAEPAVPGVPGADTAARA